MVLIVRNAQLAALAHAVRSRFGPEIAEYLTRQYPDLVRPYDAALLNGKILAAMEYAVTYGLTRRLDLQSFVAMYFYLGPGFHRHPPIHAVLTSSGIAGPHKIDVLLETVPLDEWLKARTAGAP